VRAARGRVARRRGRVAEHALGGARRVGVVGEPREIGAALL
jgi:hypothetical protein